MRAAAFATILAVLMCVAYAAGRQAELLAMRRSAGVINIEAYP